MARLPPYVRFELPLAQIQEGPAEGLPLQSLPTHKGLLLAHAFEATILPSAGIAPSSLALLP